MTGTIDDCRPIAELDFDVRLAIKKVTGGLGFDRCVCRGERDRATQRAARLVAVAHRCLVLDERANGKERERYI